MGKLADDVKNLRLRARKNISVILGAAAELTQIAEKSIKDKKISTEVGNTKISPTKGKRNTWTVKKLQDNYPRFLEAREHFQNLYGIRARSWKALAEKVNIAETAICYINFQQKENNIKET